MPHPKPRQKPGFLARLLDQDPKLALTAICALAGLLTAGLGQIRAHASEEQAQSRYTQAWVFASTQYATLDTLRADMKAMKRVFRNLRVHGTTLDLLPPEPPPLGTPRGGLLKALRKLWPW